MSNLTRKALGAAGLASVLGAAVFAAGPVGAAYAGGPGIHYVFGSTKSKCTQNLNASIKLYRSNDFEVTGVHGCRHAGDGKRYFGDFVANPR